MKFLDRILTIVITATLTSAVWIVAGGSIMQLAEDRPADESIRPAEAAPSPAADQTQAETPEPVGGAVNQRAIPAEPAPKGETATDTVPAKLDAGSAKPLKPAKNSNLMIPVLNVRASDLTDTFSGTDDNGAEPHEALDIMAPKGTSIVAAGPGTIEKMFTSEEGGKSLYLRSADRLTIQHYSHLDAYAPGLKEGQKIRRGQRLGAVGSSGSATEKRPHLHFAILRTSADAKWWEPSTAINPYPLFINK